MGKQEAGGRQSSCGATHKGNGLTYPFCLKGYLTRPVTLSRKLVCVELEASFLPRVGLFNGSNAGLGGRRSIGLDSQQARCVTPLPVPLALISQLRRIPPRPSLEQVERPSSRRPVNSNKYRHGPPRHRQMGHAARVLGLSPASSTATGPKFTGARIKRLYRSSAGFL